MYLYRSIYTSPIPVKSQSVPSHVSPALTTRQDERKSIKGGYRDKSATQIACNFTSLQQHGIEYYIK